MADNFEELAEVAGVDPLPLMGTGRGRKKGYVVPTHKLKTHCPSGHPYLGDNLVYKKRAGGKFARQCRECARTQRKAWADKNPKYTEEYKRKYYEAGHTKLRKRIEDLERALRDVLIYAPEYMHGMPKKHYEKIACGDLT